MIEILPGYGAGPLRFGMTRAEVNILFGPPTRRARRGGEASHTHDEYDFYTDLSMFVYFDQNDTCNGIEFGRASRVVIASIDVFAVPAEKLRTWVKALDAGLDTKHGFRSEKLGLAMHAPLIDEQDLTDDERNDPAQSFMVFKPGSDPG